jgi:hypothetical protein
MAGAVPVHRRADEQEGRMKTEAVQDVSLAEALEDYRRRTMVEHLMGPVISVLLHLGVLVFALFFLAGAPVERDATIPFKAVDLKVRSLDQPPEVDKRPIDQNQKFTAENPVEADVTSQGSDSPDGGAGSVADFNEAPPSTADNGETAHVCDVKMSGSWLKIPGIYVGKDNSGKKGRPPGDGTHRSTIARNDPVEIRVVNALQWLKDHQNPDGSWSNSYPVAMCGLALLTYLAHGDMADSPKYGATVQKAITYLCDRVNATGDGALVEPHCRGYSHAIATYALAEAASPFSITARSAGFRVLPYASASA